MYDCDNSRKMRVIPLVGGGIFSDRMIECNYKHTVGGICNGKENYW